MSAEVAGAALAVDVSSDEAGVADVGDALQEMKVAELFPCSKCDSMAVLNGVGVCEACVRADYSRLRNQREQATFAMTMRMDPSALANIRKEFFARQDEVTLEEFIYIVEKHLNKSDKQETPEEHREFVANMSELFKDIDVNGDGMMEWSEFTTFTVEKANILNKKMKFTAIANYHDSTEKLDPSSQHRHRHDFAQAIPILTLNQFAILEDNKNSIYIFNSMNGKLVKTIVTDAVPQAIIHVYKKDRCDLLVSACVDMTMTTHSLDDPNPNKRYKLQSTWATPGIQMALAYVTDKEVLYSGGANGNIYAWDIKQRNLLATINAHSDIVMKLLVLKKLNTLVSASLDTTIRIWDVYTHQQIMKLEGHKKGVFNLDYNAEYRLLFSCGFDHDVCVWSPFVSTMIYRLKGHHSTLVGCQCVENTNEIITADSAGVFKLWDVSKFQNLQTFFVGNSTEYGGNSGMTLTCFFHVKLPNPQQGEDDSRIFAASKTIYSLDQGRVLHEATSDFSTVQWVAWIDASSTIITVSENNLIVWDGIMGSKTSTHKNICDYEISAACLDNRKRKVILGDIMGNIGVYNPINGALMKSTVNDVNCTVVSIMYVSDGDNRRFVAGFANGLIKVYNEESLEDCGLLNSFDTTYSFPELTRLCYSGEDKTVACTGAASLTVKLWDCDTGKSEYDLSVCPEPEHVMYLGYLEPYPLLVTSDSYGNVLIWGSRSLWAGSRLSGFLNATPSSAELEPKKRTHEDHVDEFRRQYPATEEQYDEYLAQSEVGRIVGGSLSSSTVHQAALASPPKTDANNILQAIQSVKASKVDISVDDVKAEQAYCSVTQKLARESGKKWGNVAPTEAVAWDAKNYWLYTGDEQGILRKWDLRQLMEELNAETMLDEDVDTKCKFQLKTKARTRASALVPVYEQPYFGDVFASKFLVGRKNSVSNLGVDFVWGITAHNDRCVFGHAVSYGVITSATDKLVKMWTHDGLPIGCLLQSVPIGVKNRGWELALDVEGIMRKEEEEMALLMVGVEKTTNDKNKPDLATVNFAGMEPGKGSAPFNRSMLRQRIHQTSKLLGLNFQVEDGPDSVGFDDASFNGSFDGGVSTADSLATESVTSTVISKTLRQALTELKSTEAVLDSSVKGQLLTAVQARRKEAKVAAVAKKYESNRKYKLPAIKRNDDADDDGMGSRPPDSDENKHSLDVVLGIAEPKKVLSPAASLVSLKPIKKTRRRTTVAVSPKKHKRSTNEPPHGSTIQQRCSKYDSFDKLESMLNMDMKTVLSPRALEEGRQERSSSAGCPTVRVPLSQRMPSLKNLFSRQYSTVGALTEMGFFDKDTGERVPEGTPGAVTIPSTPMRMLSRMPTTVDKILEEEPKPSAGLN